MPKVLSSWSMTNEGKLIENDLKLSYSEEDGSYTIESKHESIGIVLGLDPIGKKYTIITSIPDTQRMARFKPFVNAGDILVAINDQIIVEEGFKEVTKKLEDLVKAGTPRKLTFLNRTKYSVDLFITKLELNKTVPTDLLGFMCSPEDSIIEKQYQYLNSNYLQSRDLEWVNYLKSIGGIENLKPAGIFKPFKDLKLMVRKGIPVAYRASIWPKISLSSVYRLQFPPNYYPLLLARAEQELTERVKSDIEKDVDRTFPEHRYFNPDGGGEQSLRRILYAFAVHNPTVGYCQSLNFVAGMMLIFMSEEESFWLLITVVEKLLPSDYYTKSMVGTYVDQFVLAHIIKKYLPKIHRTLESNQLQLPLITVQWFMCLFVNTLRPEVTLRIWDMFLNEGSKVLFRIAGALFKIHEKELLHVRDAGDLFTALRKLGKDVVDADVLIAAAYKSYRPNNPTTKVLASLTATPLTSSKSGKVQSTAQRLSISAKLPPTKALPRNDHLSPKEALKATNSPAMNDSSSKNRGILKKTPIYETSPRLRQHSDAGKVPNPLLGVGLAHVGPTKGPPESKRYESVTDIASYIFDVAEGATIPIDLDQEIMSAAKEMSDTLLSAESYENDQQPAKESQNEIKKEDTVLPEENPQEMNDVDKEMRIHDHKEKTSPSAVPEVSETSKLEVQSATSSNNNSQSNSTKSYDPSRPSDLMNLTRSPESSPRKPSENPRPDDSVFSNPDLILSEVRDSQMSFSSQHLRPSQQQQLAKGNLPTVSSVTGKPKRNRPFKPGEFTFTRTDIAIWRNTFRPGLQDRYERMELARAAYLQRKETQLHSNSQKEGSETEEVGEMLQGEVLSAMTITIDSMGGGESLKEKRMEEMMTSSHSAEDVSSPHSARGLSLASSSSTAVSPRLSKTGSGLSPMGAHTAVRRSIDPSTKSPIPIDEEAMQTSYNLDHQFEKE